MTNESVRHYEWFTAKITINLNFPGYEDKIFTDIEFISSFSLRQLQCCVSTGPFFPKKYCWLNVSFELLGREIPEGFNAYFHPRCCRSYDAIREMILRNVIYVLAFETCLNHIVK